MQRFKTFFWPVAGLAAVAFSFWLIYRDPAFRRFSFADLLASLGAVPAADYLLAVLATLVAYAALACYDWIALRHLGRTLPWSFISLVSFTTYALSHNIGASAFSGALVRYRAYSTKGLSAGEIGLLVAFCAFTFFLGSVLIGGLVLVIDPDLVNRLTPINGGVARLAGIAMLAFIALYVAGSLFRLKPLTVGCFRLAYPRLDIVARQLTASSCELLGAAGILYFALRDADGPSFFVVLAAFLASFSAALLSHAPGGLGVLEYVFLKAMPGLPTVKVVSALIVFRVCYLIVPLLFAIIVVIIFERTQFSRAVRANGKPTV